MDVCLLSVVWDWPISCPEANVYQQIYPEDGGSRLFKKRCYVSYVYWSVHHLDSWVKRDKLDVTCFIITLFSAQYVSDVNTSILRSLRLIRWVTSWVVLLWFAVCWCYVAVWLWWCGIRMQAELHGVTWRSSVKLRKNCVVKDAECGAALLSLCEKTANTTCYFIFISPLYKRVQAKL